MINIFMRKRKSAVEKYLNEVEKKANRDIYPLKLQWVPDDTFMEKLTGGQDLPSRIKNFFRG